MAVPKKRKSKQRAAEAKAGKRKIEFMAVSSCPNCGAPTLPHRICIACGYYDGRVHSDLAQIKK